MPKPDYSFGLAVNDDADSPIPTARIDPRTAPVLSDAFLSHVQVALGLQPWLAKGVTDMIFPCVIHEAKSDSSTLFFAENKAAGAAAKAVIVQERLCSAASTEICLPVTAFCSQGYNWEVWVAFRSPKEKIVSWLDQALGFISFPASCSFFFSLPIFHQMKISPNFSNS